jgi:small-conductance mechanosensitive channel
MQIPPVLFTIILDNTILSWMTAVLVAGLSMCGIGLVKRWVLNRLRRFAERTHSRVDDIVSAVLLRTTRLLYVTTGVWLGSRHLELQPSVEHWIRVSMILVVLIQIGLWARVAVERVAESWRMSRGEDSGAKTAVAAVAFLSKLAIGSILLVLALSVLGFEIGALVAGLGMGGVAAALAVQRLLGDVFASLTIYFGRPFEIGDFIIVGSEMGTVEVIGLRTTRLRSLGGEELVFANGDLTQSRIRNYKRMKERRVLFVLGVEYATPLAKLDQIPGFIREIVEARDGVRFERAHFKEYASYSLNFEIVYHVSSPDYNTFMDHQHAINLAIFAEFEGRGIQFAFPTQTLHVHPLSANLAEVS